MLLTKIDSPRATGRREPFAWADAEPLVTVREAAALRRCSVATVWRDVRSGRLPPPTYLAPKRPRWRLRDVLPLAAADRATAAE